MGKQLPIVDYLVLDEGEPHLTALVCNTCGARYFGRRNGCAHCAGRTFHRESLGTTGVVRSFAVVQQAAPGVEVPYVSAVVDLDGGGDVKTNIVNVEPDPANLTLGMRVALTTFVVGTDDDGTEAVAFGFEPASEGTRS